jgi:hypothetical protein
VLATPPACAANADGICSATRIARPSAVPDPLRHILVVSLTEMLEGSGAAASEFLLRLPIRD